MATDSSDPRTAREAFRLANFPTDGSAEWLNPKDLALAAAVLRTFPDERRTAVEIGVWKGAWSLGILENVPDATVLGVDPYPGLQGPEIRGILESRISAAGLADRFRLFPSLPAAASHVHPVEPVLIHVDGEHTEAGAEADLHWSGQIIAPDGLIIVDDYVHIWFPGIASAMHAFLRSADFRIVLVTENKAYLCRASHHQEWHAKLTLLLSSQSAMTWFNYFGEGGKPLYIQAPDVLGHPVLLVLGDADVLPVGHQTHSFLGLVRRAARDLLPPVLHRGLRRLVRMFKSRR
jgi:hypothetical protein